METAKPTNEHRGFECSPDSESKDWLELDAIRAAMQRATEKVEEVVPGCAAREATTKEARLHRLPGFICRLDEKG
jgi:hypothetical protein